ncbi:MAG: hypothetical protein F4Y02_15405 [Chloroflexi bacterium]|nr:hypothetical protein [Chloroflexota bacterium]
MKARVLSGCLTCTAAAVLLLGSAAKAWSPTQAVAPVTGAGIYAAHALALRAAGVSGASEAVEVIATIPGVGAVPREALASLWGPFFANAIVALGRVDSPGPMALYYNPLLDVAVVTVWTRDGDGFAVQSARALPGERLLDPNVSVELFPVWMTAPDDVGEALDRATAARLRAFARAHPPDSAEAAVRTVTFAAAARDLRALLPRLVWNGLQREQWSDGSQPWLETTLVAAEAALQAGAAGLTATAPLTDAVTAAALAELPAQFAGGLALDLALEFGAAERLLVASLPSDGDIYLAIECQLDGAGCNLQRFTLLSLNTDVP